MAVVRDLNQEQQDVQDQLQKEQQDDQDPLQEEPQNVQSGHNHVMVLNMNLITV